MLTCAQVSIEDFYVIHHEMGHIEYYMAYEDQPTIFQVRWKMKNVCYCMFQCCLTRTNAAILWCLQTCFQCTNCFSSIKLLWTEFKDAQRVLWRWKLWLSEIIFQDGVNSAFHESIGDAVMHGVVTPQHLHRLGLISDEDLTDPAVELSILLQQALARIPEIPFSLLIDKYRWDIFDGKITYSEYNRQYWDLNSELRGIVPPETRTEEYFDAGAKFHIPDNTPYIR